MHRIPSNHVASLDPRTRTAHLMVAIDEARFARFEPGNAVLRAHAFGAPQWLRIPPPKVQDVAVRIRPNSPAPRD